MTHDRFVRKYVRLVESMEEIITRTRVMLVVGHEASITFIAATDCAKVQAGLQSPMASSRPH